MEDILHYSNLFDYYHKLLTDTQQTYFKEYYFYNLSLQEIADNFKVSKNAISKTLIDVTNKLDHYESILKLSSNKEEINKLLNKEDFKKIEDYI